VYRFTHGIVVHREIVADRVDDLLETYIAQYVSQRRAGGEISRLLRREIGNAWGSRSIHEITKRDVVEVITAIEQRGAPIAANKTLKTLKTFLRWCVGRAVLDQSPADGIPLPAKEVSRDRVLVDDELARRMESMLEPPAPGDDQFLSIFGPRKPVKRAPRRDASGAIDVPKRSKAA
jgi:site-specific recombinase XerC